MTNKYFAGGNTKNGFVNLYSHVADNQSVKKLVIIKGGSGVGKSTIMKKVAEKFKSQPIVECFHCTGDLNSLDGVNIPSLNIAMVDGTAPHVIEPVLVKATDFTLDLSKHINEQTIRGQKIQIAKLMRKKGEQYLSAWAYIKAAGALFDRSLCEIKQSADPFKITAVVEDFIKMIDLASISNEGKVRKMFGGAITCEGETYFGNYYDGKVIYLGGDKKLASLLLSALYVRLVGLNADLTVYYSPISTDCIYDIKCGSYLFTTNENNRAINGEINLNVDEELRMDKAILSEQKLASENYNLLITQASMFLKKAKDYHMEIEKIYVPSVNFDGVNDDTQMLLNFLDN